MSMQPIRNDGSQKNSTPLKVVEGVSGAKRRIRRAALNGASMLVGVFLIFVVIVVFTTDISLSNTLALAVFGLTFAILLFCSYSMFVNFYSSGIRAGCSTEIYAAAYDTYDNLKKEIINSKTQGRLSEFCRYFIIEELKNSRTAILSEVGISYETYITTYIGADKKTLKKNEKLSKTQVAAIMRANRTKPIKLTPEMILKRGRGSSSRRPLGIKPETRKGVTFSVRFFKTLLTSGLTGIIMLDVIVNPTWATFAACCLKLMPVILNGFVGYRMGYENITIDTVNYMGDQTDLIQQFLQYIGQHPQEEQYFPVEKNNSIESESAKQSLETKELSQNTLS